MSFWRTFGFHAVSAIDTLLENTDVTLEQLLDEDDLLQETKSQNKKLIDFLCQPETLQKLIRYITAKTEHEDDPKLSIKYPFLACEVLASEVWSIYDAIANDSKLMDMLYSFFEKDPPLDIQLSAYTARVAILLLQKKVTETVSFLKQKKEIVDQFLKHLGNPAVMDLLLKLISCEDPQTGNAGALEWLQSTNLIKSLVEKFKPTNTPETHENVAHTLVEIIKIGPNAGPLIEQLESKVILEELFGYMLENKNGSELSYGVNVLMALIVRHSKDQYNDSITAEQLPEPLTVILHHIEGLTKFLESPSYEKEKEKEKGENNNNATEKKEEVSSTKAEAESTTKPGKEEIKEGASASMPSSVLNFFGKRKLKSTVGEIEPVGFCRLRLIDFFSCLARTNVQAVDKVLANKDVFKKCIDMFFAHPWNNFLHSSVEAMIRGALESPNEDLKTHILRDCHLLEKIIANNKLNNELVAKPKGMRLGNMGHITSLVFVITEMSSHSPAIEKLISENPEWLTYSKGVMETSVNVSNSFGFSQDNPIELAPEDNMDSDSSVQYVMQSTSFSNFSGFGIPSDFTNQTENGDDEPSTGMEPFEPSTGYSENPMFFAQLKSNTADDSDESDESDEEDTEAVVAAKTVAEDEEEEISENLQNTDFGTKSKQPENEKIPATTETEDKTVAVNTA